MKGKDFVNTDPTSELLIKKMYFTDHLILYFLFQLINY